MTRVCQIISFAFLVFLASCASDKELYQGKLEHLLGIKIVEEYSVLESSSNSAIGDYTETFMIQFEPHKFDQLEQRLNLNTFEKSLDEAFLYLNEEDEKGNKVSVVINLKKHTIKYTLADI